MKHNRKKERKQIEELKKEYSDNNKILEKNKNNLNEQIDLGLKFSYELEKEKLERDLIENEIAVNSGIEGVTLLNPKHKFQNSKEFKKLLFDEFKKKVIISKKALETLDKARNEVIDVINDQNSRIKERRKQIIELLEQLGVDVTTAEFKL